MIALLAGIVLVGPFTGQSSEGFENHQRCEQLACVPDRLFGGRADLCVGGDGGDCTIAGSLAWPTYCTTTPRQGASFLWTQTSHYYSSYAEITFDDPAVRFGGYFASWSTVAELDFSFFAEDGTLIRTIHDGSSPASCAWTWHGFDLSDTGPCKRVRISNSAWFGLEMDNLQADWAPPSDGIDTCFPGYDPVVACPCSSTGTIPNGCGSSRYPGGAHLGSSGTASLSHDTLVLSATRVAGTSCSIIEAGLAARGQSAVYGQGVACWGSAPARLFSGPAVGGSFSAPGAGQPSVSGKSARAGHPLQAGTGMAYCVVYRDPLAVGTCAAGMLSVSQAHNVVWAP